MPKCSTRRIEAISVGIGDSIFSAARIRQTMYSVGILSEFVFALLLLFYVGNAVTAIAHAERVAFCRKYTCDATYT